MPLRAPALTTEALTGKRLEICWGTYRTTEGGERTAMWCPCAVLRVADGGSDKGAHGKNESSRARKLLPARAILVQWAPDPERGEEEATVMWLVLHPERWNGNGHLAWRWDAAELAKRQAAAGPSAQE